MGEEVNPRGMSEHIRPDMRDILLGVVCMAVLALAVAFNPPSGWMWAPVVLWMAADTALAALLPSVLETWFPRLEYVPFAFLLGELPAYVVAWLGFAFLLGMR